MEPQERAAKIAARKARQKKLLAKKRGCEKRRFLEVSGCGCLKQSKQQDWKYWLDLTVQRTIVKSVFCEIMWDYGAWRDSLTVIDQISCKSFSREIERHWESLSPMKHAIMKIDIEINRPHTKQSFPWMHQWNIVELWAWDIIEVFEFRACVGKRPCLECPWFHSIYCFNIYIYKIHIS